MLTAVVAGAKVEESAARITFILNETQIQSTRWSLTWLSLAMSTGSADETTQSARAAKIEMSFIVLVGYFLFVQSSVNERKGQMEAIG